LGKGKSSQDTAKMVGISPRKVEQVRNVIPLCDPLRSPWRERSGGKHSPGIRH